MPILPAEPDIYPEELLDGDPPASDSAHCWWALYTLPRREKDLMRRLRSMQVAHYAPMVKRRTRSPNGRARQSFVPLFSSYVFFCGDESARYKAMTTNCVSQYLEVDDVAQLVCDLRQIQRLIRSDVPMTPEARLQPGNRVRIRSGSLAGTEGVVLKRRGGDRLLIAVRFLQQGASVQLEDFQVEPIDP